MRQKPIVKKYSLPADELERQVQEAMGEIESANIPKFYEDSIKDFEPEKIVKGKILNVTNDEVIIDVGYKSEGVVPKAEFDEGQEPIIGAEIEVLLESVEDELGAIVLSKKKADRIRGWERLISTKQEGNTVEGKVIRKIKGGLLLDVGVPVFLPASQIDIRRTGDISEYIGKELKAQIIKVDESRMNIVVSRRRLIEEERKKMKERLLEELQEGQVRAGTVKNIADFGAFVDLGGIDGLLHITDMSWGRISHPSEMLAIDQQVEVKVLKLDRKRERIALGLKQKSESPWKDIEIKYPVNSRVKGRVVNVMNYGAFVKLEDGIEGLVHISEMSWTRRVTHPSEIVNIGDEVEVVILDINKEKQEISLGMKQVEANPWTLVEQKYPVSTIINGRVRNLTNYGAFVEIEEGIDGLLHISDMSWTKKVSHPSEMLKKGDRIQAKVLSVDQERRRVALGMKQLTTDPWEQDIPGRYKPDDVAIGKVTKLTNFGVFVELEKDLEGLLHISELTDRKIKSPDEVVMVGDKVEVRILRVDGKERKIGLSLVRARPGEEEEEESAIKPKRKGLPKGEAREQSSAEIKDRVPAEAEKRVSTEVKPSPEAQETPKPSPEAQETPKPSPQAQETPKPSPQAQETTPIKETSPAAEGIPSVSSEVKPPTKTEAQG